MRPIADVQAAGHADAGFGEHFDFVDERRGIHHHARSDDDVLLGAQDAAGNQLENIAVFADDDCMAGIVAAGDARDVIKRARQIVNDLAFAFIAPLRANHYDRFHSETLLEQTAASRELGKMTGTGDRRPQRKIRATHQFEIVRWAPPERKRARYAVQKTD